ncbi:esterase [Thermosipho ferrireducens]|uniref:Esterase n=1 Tax=Thermosipho ferrireducens TaxID=2571116 RepID=A0ABX7SAJ5_9BACT|nr:esterase [Thermosipho ferrireducens]
MTILLLCFYAFFISGFSLPLYEYKLKNIVVYRSLEKLEDPFFSYDSIDIKDWKPFAPQLLELQKGKTIIILVHGISPREVYNPLDIYKQAMINAFKKSIPDNVGLYLFLYPSLVCNFKSTGESLVNFTRKFDKFYIYAHSLGGIIVRYALQSEEFQQKVQKVIFAGTPHRGSPLATFLALKKEIFKNLNLDTVELIKFALITSNAFGASIEAPVYKKIIFGKKFPEVPDNVNYINFVGILTYNFSNTRETIQNILLSNPLTLAGLLLLKYISDNIFPESSEFRLSDGMVPYVSANYNDKSIVFYGANHADLAMRRDIIEKALAIFGILKE